ncbi:hypothetical protein BKA93DRAFT_830190 [Sparassis latifolia]
MSPPFARTLSSGYLSSTTQSLSHTDSLDNVSVKWIEEVRFIHPRHPRQLQIRLPPTRKYVHLLFINLTLTLPLIPARLPSTCHSLPPTLLMLNPPILPPSFLPRLRLCAAGRVEGVDDVFDAVTCASMLMREGVPVHVPAPTTSAAAAWCASRGAWFWRCRFTE